MDRNVLFVVNDPMNFHLHRRPVADALKEAGWSVQVAGPLGQGADQVVEAGYEYHSVSLQRKSINPVTEASTVRSLASLYRRLVPSLVHQFTMKPVVYGGIAANRSGVPAVVSTITGLGYVFASNSMKARLLRPVIKQGFRRTFKHPNHTVVFQNPDDMTFLEGMMNGSRTALIPGAGIDASRYPPFPVRGDRVPVVALAGRLLKDKGVLEFVEAARTLHRKGIAARFALIGDTDPGNPAAVPRDRLIRWEREGVVEWWGWRDDILDLLDDIDVACLPSYREGFPRYLLEAATRGRPIVTTEVPGCRALVCHNENGWLVPPRDPQALAEAISALAVDPDLRRRMGMAGRARVEKEFDTKQVVKATIQVYEQALDHSGFA